MGKFLFLALVFFVSTTLGYAETFSPAEGKALIAKADKRFYPEEGTWQLLIKTVSLDNKNLEYHLDVYIKGTNSQTAVYNFPKPNKGDVAMKMNDVIYNKQSKWPKPQILSYQSVFVDSAFNYGDVVSSDLASDYDAKSIESGTEDGKACYVVTLNPQRSGLYPKIILYIEKSSLVTLKRSYFTASGELEKESRFKDIVEKGGKIISFNIEMKNLLLGIDSSAEITDIKAESLPAFLFDPQNIGRIHAK